MSSGPGGGAVSSPLSLMISLRGGPASLHGSASLVTQPAVPSRRDIRPSLEAFILDFNSNALRKKSYRELLVYIPFLVLILFYLIGDRSFGPSYFILDGLNNNIITQDFVLPTPPPGPTYKTYYDVSSISDWFTFLTSVLPSLWDLSTARMLYAFGSVRLRKWEVDPGACSVLSRYVPNNSPYFNQQCYPVFSSSVQVTSGSGYLSCAQAPAATLWGASDLFYPCGGFIVDISIQNVSMANATSQLQALQNSGWITRQTAAVVIEYYMYNPSENVFVSVKQLTEFLASGAILPQAQVRPFQMEQSFAGGFEWFLVLLQFLLVAYVFYFIVDLIRCAVHWKRNQPSVWTFFGFWVFFDMIFLTLFLITISLRAYLWIYPYSPAGAFDITATPFPNLDTYVGIYTLDVEIDAVVALLTFLRTFKFLRLNDRLNLLGRTLSGAASDILGFFVMFIVVFLGFACFAYVAFGPYLYNYHTFWLSVTNSFLIILGNSDYSDQTSVNRVLGPIYYFGFVIVVFFVLFNVFLAIVNDSYGTAVESSSSHSIGEAMLNWIADVKAWIVSRFRRQRKHRQPHQVGGGKNGLVVFRAPLQSTRYATTGTAGGNENAVPEATGESAAAAAAAADGGGGDGDEGRRFPSGTLTLVELGMRMERYFMPKPIDQEEEMEEMKERLAASLPPSAAAGAAGSGKSGASSGSAAASSASQETPGLQLCPPGPIFRHELPLRLRAALSAKATSAQVFEILRLYDVFEMRKMREMQQSGPSGRAGSGSAAAGAGAAVPMGANSSLESLYRQIDTKLNYVANKMAERDQ